MCFFIFAGVPVAITLSGKLRLTTEPAATTQLLPMVTPGRIMLFAPIQQLLPILIGAWSGG